MLIANDSRKASNCFVFSRLMLYTETAFVQRQYTYFEQISPKKLNCRVSYNIFPKFSLFFPDFYIFKQNA